MTREHGLLFTAPMIRAILDGTKLQTRRPVTPHTSEIGSLPQRDWTRLDFSRARVDTGFVPYPYLHVPHLDGPGEDMHGTSHRVYSRAEPGHVMWARETWQPLWANRDVRPASMKSPEGWAIGYVATDGVQEYRDENKSPPLTTACKPAIHMPRWAARIVRPILSVRVERVQDISEEDARAEGFADRAEFFHTWEGIYGDDLRAWVWAITFASEAQS